DSGTSRGRRLLAPDRRRSVVNRRLDHSGSFFVGMTDWARRDPLEGLIGAEQKETTATDVHLVALMKARRGHLVTVDHDILGIGRGLDPEASLLPADSSVDGGDSLPLLEDVAGWARAEEHGVIARQVDELNAALTVVDFQCGHAKKFSSGTGGRIFGPI